jgi:pyridinium-3,5-bisthiocarboxylic acid mononucleotide nickel chelatase
MLIGPPGAEFLILSAPCYPCKGCAMKTAYFDAFSGLSGDMIVGAILDCGADFSEFERAMNGVAIKGYRLSTRRKVSSGISALKFDVEVNEPQPERHFGEIRTMITSSSLAEAVKRRAIAIFEVLAEAEAKIHNTTPDRVHFHEVGAVDSIIDIIGTAWGLDYLGVGDVIISPLPMGRGFARSQHGVIPVPAPATAELLAGFAVKLGDGAAEMVTPTGAAVVRALARSAEIPLDFEIEKIGYGAGTRDLDDRPNVLRMMLGRQRAALDTDEMIEISANIDDLNPQIYDHVMEKLFAAGARDVTLTPTMMKKGRPAVTLSVITEPANRDAIAEIVFAETSTIGIRFHSVARLKLAREILEVETRWGKIRVKVSGAHGRAANTISPEYDDCRRIAAAHGVALRVVIDEARDAARAQVK